MTTIYIVTSGSYSDYGIHGAFLNKEKAQAYCDYHNECNPGYHDAEVEEWEEEVIPEEKWYTVQSKMNSIEVEQVRHTDKSPASRNMVGHWSYSWKTEELPNITYHVDVVADNPDHAKKIAADLFREYKALH